MNGLLLNRNVIRLILTAPPAKVLRGVPTEKIARHHYGAASLIAERRIHGKTKPHLGLKIGRNKD